MTTLKVYGLPGDSVRPLPNSAATFAYEIDDASGLALARMAGTLSGEDMLAVLQCVHRDERWRPHFDAIWECSEVDVHVVSPTEVKPIVEETVDRQTGRDVLVENDVLADSILSEMLAAYCRREGKEVVVHSTLTQALQELGYDALPGPLAALVRMT